MRRSPTTEWPSKLRPCALSEARFPDADKIVLVQDNLSTHTTASLYEAFPAAEARRLVERFDWPYTPKRGSWLDMAETELAVLSTQCLDRRIPDKETLIDEPAAWEQRRNTHHAEADWQFTTADARIKLARLYPSVRVTRATSRFHKSCYFHITSDDIRNPPVYRRQDGGGRALRSAP
jgi:hypothetical protein